jgi:hypothetical protein
MKTTKDYMDGPEFSELLQTMGSFLCWATEDGAEYGGVRAEEAFQTFATMMGWDQFTTAKFYEIFTGDEL